MARESQWSSYCVYEAMSSDVFSQKDETREEMKDIHSIVADFTQQFRDNLIMLRQQFVEQFAEMIREEVSNIHSQSVSYSENPTKSRGSSPSEIVPVGFTVTDEAGYHGKAPDLIPDCLMVEMVIGNAEVEQSKEKNEEKEEVIDYCEDDASPNRSGIRSNLIQPTSSLNKYRSSTTVAYPSTIEGNQNREVTFERSSWFPDRHNWIWLSVEGRNKEDKAHINEFFIAQGQTDFLKWPKPNSTPNFYWPKPYTNLFRTFTLPAYPIVDDHRKPPLPPPPWPALLPQPLPRSPIPCMPLDHGAHLDPKRVPNSNSTPDLKLLIQLIRPFNTSIWLFPYPSFSSIDIEQPFSIRSLTCLSGYQLTQSFKNILNWPNLTPNSDRLFTLPTYSVLLTADGRVRRDDWSDYQRKLPPPPVPPPLPPPSAIKGEVGFKAPLNITIYWDQFQFMPFSKDESVGASHKDWETGLALARHKRLRPRFLFENPQPPLTNGKMTISLSNGEEFYYEQIPDATLDEYKYTQIDPLMCLFYRQSEFHNFISNGVCGCWSQKSGMLLTEENGGPYVVPLRQPLQKVAEFAVVMDILIEPIKRAMEEINAAARLRMVATKSRKTVKAIQIKRAKGEGEADSKFQSQAIMNDERDCMLGFSINVLGTMVKGVRYVVLATRYCAIIKEKGNTFGSYAIFILHGPDVSADEDPVVLISTKMTWNETLGWTRADGRMVRHSMSSIDGIWSSYGAEMELIQEELANVADGWEGVTTGQQQFLYFSYPP